MVIQNCLLQLLHLNHFLQLTNTCFETFIYIKYLFLIDNSSLNNKNTFFNIKEIYIFHEDSNKIKVTTNSNHSVNCYYMYRISSGVLYLLL